MLVAISAAQRLDWDGWIRGIIGAVVSGGAGAVSAGFGAMVFDPNKDFAFGTAKLFELMGFCFMFSGVISLAKFLQSNPIPQMAQVNVTAPATITQTQTTETKTVVEPKNL